MTLGHIFTQGTADSNEVWVDVMAHSGEQVVGRSGGMKNDDGEVDPWSHFVNAYVIDRDGNRIDRRNPENIFTPLYSNQIPPGAADVVHYRFTVPENAGDTYTVAVALQYRKFDTNYMRLFQGEDFETNDLPIVTVATDTITFPVSDSAELAQEASDIPEWQRWNDFGIGLLRKRDNGQLRQAEEAFKAVERLDKADGPLNLARVYLREGRLEEAVTALQRASDHESPAYPWSVAWFTALTNRQNGYLDEAIAGFESLVETRFQEARNREFDFSQDYRLLNTLAGTLFDRAQLERAQSPEWQALMDRAAETYHKALEIDPENDTAHYGLAQIYSRTNAPEKEELHRNLHAKYRVDDNARDRAVRLAREKSAPANHAADAVVIYDLQRPGAFELPATQSAPQLEMQP